MILGPFGSFAWYCSEPRLAFNRIVVVRYRMYLESRGLAANTINQQLAAVRRLAYEAADAGLLSPELAAGIEGPVAFDFGPVHIAVVPGPQHVPLLLVVCHERLSFPPWNHCAAIAVSRP
jgi:hypothetical protein